MSNSGINAGLALMAAGNAMRANAEAARADEAEEALGDVYSNELNSIGTIVSKKDVFRQAADAMISEITSATSKNMTSDLSDIRVRKHWYSFFESSVPSDMRLAVSREAQEILNATVKEVIAEFKKDYAHIGAYGAEGIDGEIYFDRGRGVEFVADLDDNETAAMARLGVLNALEEGLGERELGERPSDSTRQKHRALGVAFDHAASKAMDICAEKKAPYEKIIMANLPPAFEA